MILEERCVTESAEGCVTLSVWRVGCETGYIEGGMRDWIYRGWDARLTSETEHINHGVYDWPARQSVLRVGC